MFPRLTRLHASNRGIPKLRTALTHPARPDEGALARNRQVSNFDSQPRQYNHLPRSQIQKVPVYFQHDGPQIQTRPVGKWRDEPLWLRWTTYTASVLTLCLFWSFYQYREPTYALARMQLCILNDEDIDNYIRAKIQKTLDLVGVYDFEHFYGIFGDPNPVPGKFGLAEIYRDMNAVYEHLVRASAAEPVMGADLHLVDHNDFMESKFNCHPTSIIVYYGELETTLPHLGSPGLPALLTPRIVRKAMFHDCETLNSFVFCCFASIPAILFGGVAWNSRVVRPVAVPYLIYYGMLVLFHNTWLKTRQENEATYTSMIIMMNAGYDPAEMIGYRKRQVERGERELLERELQASDHIGILDWKDVVLHKLKLSPLHRWIAEQRRFMRAAENLLPKVQGPQNDAKRALWMPTTKDLKDGCKGEEKDEDSGSKKK